MKEIERFENAKAGDKVWSCINGVGRIASLDQYPPYYIGVEFLNGKDLDFSVCGRSCISDVFPQIYHSEEEFIKERLAIHGHLLERVTAPSFVPDLSPGAVNTADISKEHFEKVREEETIREFENVHKAAGRPDRAEKVREIFSASPKMSNAGANWELVNSIAESKEKKKREDALDFLKNDLVAINEEISDISEYLGGFSDSKGIELEIAARRIKGVYNLIGNLIDKEVK